VTCVWGLMPAFRGHREWEPWIGLCLGIALMASPLAAEENMIMRLNSPAFLDGAPIPVKYYLRG
jgi:hypothetical protein